MLMGGMCREGGIKGDPKVCGLSKWGDCGDRPGARTAGEVAGGAPAWGAWIWEAARPPGGCGPGVGGGEGDSDSQLRVGASRHSGNN